MSGCGGSTMMIPFSETGSLSASSFSGVVSLSGGLEVSVKSITEFDHSLSLPLCDEDDSLLSSGVPRGAGHFAFLAALALARSRVCVLCNWMVRTMAIVYERGKRNDWGWVVLIARLL